MFPLIVWQTVALIVLVGIIVRLFHYFRKYGLQIRANEAYLRTLFDTMPSGMGQFEAVRDESGNPLDFRFINVNRAFKEIIKIGSEDVLGKNLGNCFPYVQIIEGEKGAENLIAACKTALDGSVRYFRAYNPVQKTYEHLTIFSTGPNRIGVFIVDETFRVRSERQLRTMQLIIDGISQPVFWLYLDGTIQYSNDAAAVAWGYESTGKSPHGPVGEKIWRYDPTKTTSNWNDFVSSFDQDTVVRQFDTTIQRLDGTKFPAVVAVNLLEQNGEPFFAVSFQDLTDQTERIKAEQRVLAKTTFLDQMTHEIRTPLNGVICSVDLIDGTKLDEQQREYVKMAKISGERLLSILSNVFDYSLLDAGNLALEEKPFELRELVESQYDAIYNLAKQQNSPVAMSVTYSPELPKRIIGDPVRLRQILFNLLDNALKFTPKGSNSLNVGVTTSPPESDCLVDENGPFLDITLKDTGIGIADNILADLYEPFVMGDISFSRVNGGNGLGLPIVRGLVRKMSGDIFVESRVNAGSTFRFVIPLKQADDNADNASVSNDATFVQALPEETMVLIVEDNRINRIVAGEILKQAGYRYEFAENGLQACEAVRDKEFNIILMDCQMPVMDGFEATMRIRAMEAGQDEWQPAHRGHIPIIAVTANALAGDEQNCRNSGMDDFCSKPVNAEQLLGVIRNWNKRTR